MAGNIIKLAYGYLKGQGVDTDNMTPDDAIKKYNEMTGNRQNATYGNGDNQSLTKSKNGSKINKAVEFSRIQTKHHKRHSEEMGFKSLKEYEKAAINFFNGSDGDVYYGRLRDDYSRYDINNERYVVCDKEGRIKTYYKLSEKDFNKISKQEKFEKYE